MDQYLITVNSWISAGPALAALGCFLWGLVSVLFSPCHLASIPLLVSYVAAQDKVRHPRQGLCLALVFTGGLFVTIALVGMACWLLGRLLGDLGWYGTALVGVMLVWVGLDMLELVRLPFKGGLMAKLRVRGRWGALVLGLAYGLLSGSCTFGFLAPVLALTTVQDAATRGLLLVGLFGLGHCLPIAVAGSSMALVNRVLGNARWQDGSQWMRRAAGAIVGGMGVYFLSGPLLAP